MSFGFSVGDFIAVPAFAYRVYRLCKDSSAEFQDVSGLVISMHCVLKEVAKFSEDLDPDQQEQLVIVGSRCQSVLLELEKLLLRYATLSTKKHRIWDKLRWGLEDVKSVKGRLVENTILLNCLSITFMNSSQGRVEVKLDKYTTEIRAGKRPNSVLSCRSTESLVSHDGQAWLKLRQELEAIGISAPILEQHQQFIIGWFDEAVSAGALEKGCNVARAEQGLFTNRSASHTTEEPNLTDRTDVAQGGEAEGSRLVSYTRPSSPDATFRLEKQDELDERLQHAVRYGITVQAEGLLDSGANPGRYDLHRAAFRGSKRIVGLLLDKGANIDARDDYGRSALHCSMSSPSDLELIRLLLERGADPRVKDNEGMTALDRMSTLSRGYGGDQATRAAIIKVLDAAMQEGAGGCPDSPWTANISNLERIATSHRRQRVRRFPGETLPGGVF